MKNKCIMIIMVSNQASQYQRAVSSPENLKGSKMQVVINKPTLVGSEKQIAWATDLINTIASIFDGKLTLPATATPEQAANAQRVMDEFFAQTSAAKWIDRFAGINQRSPFSMIAAEARRGWTGR